MTTKFDVVEWFAEKAGKTCYKTEVNKLKEAIEAAKTDEDREHGMMMISVFEEEIERVYREAQDRYDDWVTDIDYD